MKHASIPELIETLLGDDDWAAIDAAEALGAMRAREAVPALIQTLHAEDWHRLLRESLDHAQKCGDLRGAVAIAEHVGGSIYDLQMKSAEALALIGDRQAVPELIAVVQDKNHAYYAAVRALGTLKAEEAVPVLASLLISKEAKRTRLCDVAKEALENIGSPEALEAIRRWKDSDSGRSTQESKSG